METHKSFKSFFIEKLKNILIASPIERYDSNKRLTTAKTFNVLICISLIYKHINDNTLVPANQRSRQPGGKPQTEAGSECGEDAKAGNELHGIENGN